MFQFSDHIYMINILLRCQIFVRCRTFWISFANEHPGGMR